MTNPQLHPDLTRDDDDVGEFFLPAAEQHQALDPAEEREQYDSQILAGLVSP